MRNHKATHHDEPSVSTLVSIVCFACTSRRQPWHRCPTDLSILLSLGEVPTNLSSLLHVIITMATASASAAAPDMAAVSYSEKNGGGGGVSEFIVHIEHICNKCFQRPILGRRYTSDVISNFNLCASCFESITSPGFGFTETALGKLLLMMMYPQLIIISLVHLVCLALLTHRVTLLILFIISQSMI